MCNHHHNRFQDIFNHIAKSPPTAPPALGKPQFFPSVFLDFLSWTLHINGTIYYVDFCVWLPSFGMMFSRFIRVVAGFSISSPLALRRYSPYGETHLSLNIQLCPVPGCEIPVHPSVPRSEITALMPTAQGKHWYWAFHTQL